MKSLLKKYTKEKDSSRSLSKSKIAKEATLVDIFYKSIQFENQDFIAFEFETSNGIADLILCGLRKDWQKYGSLRLIDPRWVYALVKLPYRREFSIDDFTSFSGASIARSRQALRQYVSAGFCSNLGTNRWIKIKQPRPIINNCCAIEAKLSDWKRALSQAFRYYDFSNESWVILDEATSNSAVSNIHEFERLNVGLATINNTGHISKKFNPRKRPHKSDISFWYANSQIAKALIP